MFALPLALPLALPSGLALPDLIFQATRTIAAEGAPLSALVWWLIPLFAFIGAIAYVIWVSKFQSKYENETNRSVGRFQKFQKSLEKGANTTDFENRTR
ncbi:MAG: hypothetical protein ACKOFU_02680 [Actinomycetota bacterium]